MGDLGDKDRAELFRWLADTAFQRFESRRRVAWQVNVVVWAALGASVALLFGDHRIASVYDFVMVAGFTIGVVLLHTRRWVPYALASNAVDQRRAYYWVSAVEGILGYHTPVLLRPGGWVCFDPGEHRPKGERVDERIFSNRSALAEVLTTYLLGLAVVTAALANWQLRSESVAKPITCSVTLTTTSTAASTTTTPTPTSPPSP